MPEDAAFGFGVKAEIKNITSPPSSRPLSISSKGTVLSFGALVQESRVISAREVNRYCISRITMIHLLSAKVAQIDETSVFFVS